MFKKNYVRRFSSNLQRQIEHLDDYEHFYTFGMYMPAFLLDTYLRGICSSDSSVDICRALVYSANINQLLF